MADLTANSDFIFVAVKAKDAYEVLKEIAGLARDEQVIVSCMAGVTIDWIRRILGPGPALLRIMPNLGVGLGVGAVAVAPEPGTPEKTVQAVLRLLEVLGLAEVTEEGLLDAYTAVSGSGPAFLALAIEGLEDGAVSLGLTRSFARSLVRNQLLQAVRLMQLRSCSSAELAEEIRASDDVAGAGMDVLEARQVRAAFALAVATALERCRHLQETSPPPQIDSE